MSKAEFERYAAAVQSHFGRKRGASLLVSPDDFLKIEEWFEKGIPLRAVQKGLDRHFEKIDESKRRRAVVLRFAEGAILNEWELMKSGGMSDAGRRQSPEEEAVERKEQLGIFVQALRKRRGACEVWICRLLDELIEMIEGAPFCAPLPQIEEEIENSIEKFLRDNATPERMRTARLTAEHGLAQYKGKMSDDDYRNSLESNTFQALRIELGVPSLTGEM